MTRAAAYYRVSTGRQAEADRHSLPTQKEDAHAWCEARGLTLVAEFQDAETGTTANREQYQNMLAAVRAGEFEVVCIRAISRLGREQ